jgi:hypothetical protein
LYNSIKNLPRSKKRDELLNQVWEKDLEAIAEVKEAIKLNIEFLNLVKFAG